MKPFLDETINVRLRKEELEGVRKVVDAMPDRYDNVSHFIRCAIISQIRIDQTYIRRR